MTVCGSEAGIGFAIVDKLAQSGAAFLPGRSCLHKQQVVHLAEKIRGSRSVGVLELTLEVSSSTSIDSAVASVRERFGGIDTLINNTSAPFPNL